MTQVGGEKQLGGQRLLRLFVSSSIVFVSLSLLYKLAPRRHKRFAEVWAAALCATVLLGIAEGVFVIYLKNFAFKAFWGGCEAASGWCLRSSLPSAS